jgi:SMI1/KNR4 family protein SUKH-1
MDETRFNDLASRLRALSSDSLCGTASSRSIEELQADLGVTLPDDYIAFLAAFAAADFPFDIFGVEPDVRTGTCGSTQSVLDITMWERHLTTPPMPHHLVPIQPDGLGNHWCLDTSRLTAGICPVVFWNHDGGPEQIPEHAHDTFLDFLEAVIKNEEVNWR